MLLHIILAIEILSVIVCLHCIYGRKIGLDVKTILLFVSLLVLLEILNNFPSGGLYSYLGYVIIFFYCKREFKSSFMRTAVNMLLFIVILTAIEFVCMIFLKVWIPEREGIRALLENIIVLGICIFILPKCNLSRLQGAMDKKNKFLILVLCFMLVVVMAILLQGKICSGVQAEYFVLAVPAVILLLISIEKWHAAQTHIKNLKQEMKESEKTGTEYNELLMKVRMHQHELKNHLAAIRFARHTHERNERLMQEQEEYCKELMHENRYDGLLLLESNILTGFLYRKFLEAEAKGISVVYKGAVKIENIAVPVFHLIEMLGILLDNAMEALEEMEEGKRIYFSVMGLEAKYRFTVRNPFSYVPYNRMVEWFQADESSKGAGRGIGLYHLKCLCGEWGCSIVCGNAEIDDVNWIEFALEIERADSA